MSYKSFSASQDALGDKAGDKDAAGKQKIIPMTKLTAPKPAPVVKS